MFNVIAITAYFREFLMNKKPFVIKWFSLFVLLSVVLIVPMASYLHYKKLDKRYLSSAKIYSNYNNIVIDDIALGSFFRIINRIDNEHNIFVSNVGYLTDNFDDVVKNKDDLIYISNDVNNDKSKLVNDISDKYIVENIKFKYGNLYIINGKR